MIIYILKKSSSILMILHEGIPLRTNKWIPSLNLTWNLLKLDLICFFIGWATLIRSRLTFRFSWLSPCNCCFSIKLLISVVTLTPDCDRLTSTRRPGSLFLSTWFPRSNPAQCSSTCTLSQAHQNTAIWTAWI